MTARSPVNLMDQAPLSALVFKIATDPFVGRLVFIRVIQESCIQETPFSMSEPARGKE